MVDIEKLVPIKYKVILSNNTEEIVIAHEYKMFTREKALDQEVKDVEFILYKPMDEKKPYEYQVIKVAYLTEIKSIIMDEEQGVEVCYGSVAKIAPNVEQ